MTKEERTLVIKDICARLPYGVKMCSIYNDGFGSISTEGIYILKPTDMYYRCCDEDEDIPYLRPLSSITKSEKEEYQYLCDYFIDSDENKYYFNNCATIDWYNQKHFDYRGLIKLGLALEAPEGMYDK